MTTIDVVDEAGTEVLRAEAAEHLAGQFVGFLQLAGIDPGSRILFQAPNSARLLSAIFGALRARYVPVVISDKLTARERDELCSDVDPALIVDENLLAGAFTAEPAALGERFHCRPMHFTSGTSGRPKGVWSGWFTPELSTAWLDEEVNAWGIRSSDRHLVCAPMSHSAPLRFPLVTLAAGGTVVIPAAFSPETVSALLTQCSATTTFMAPAHLQRLLDTCPPVDPNMRLVAHAGSSCPENVRAAARETFGDEAIREFYGSTEGQFTICSPREFDGHLGTVGRARPGRQLRTDDDSRIWCRVPDHARFEYWGDPNKTAEAWDGDWFTVGDIGHLDEEGYLYLSGRRGDLIITGGVNVYPAEIERVVLDLPQVPQAVVFAVDDEKWGQRVCLAVVGSASEEEINAHCANLLAPYKRPKAVFIVEELPHTHSGKIDRLRVARYLGIQE